MITEKEKLKSIKKSLRQKVKPLIEKFNTTVDGEYLEALGIPDSYEDISIAIRFNKLYPAKIYREVLRKLKFSTVYFCAHNDFFVFIDDKDSNEREEFYVNEYGEHESSFNHVLDYEMISDKAYIEPYDWDLSRKRRIEEVKRKIQG